MQWGLPRPALDRKEFPPAQKELLLGPSSTHSHSAERQEKGGWGVEGETSAFSSLPLSSSLSHPPSSGTRGRSGAMDQSSLPQPPTPPPLRAGEDRKYSRCKKKCHGSSRHNAGVMVGWVATFIFLRTRAVKIKGAQTPVKKRGGHIYHRASNPRRMKNGTKKSFGTFAEQKMG